MLAISKPGQGFYTRTMSAIALALIALMGVAWLWKLFSNVRWIGGEPVYGQAIMAVLVLAAVGLLGFWLIGVKPRSVDFLIATEGELKKVNWSTRREVMGSTALVIGFTLFMAVLCFLADLLFQLLFQTMNVLERAT
jgi:preprotein translocase subunit SecE